MRGDLLKALLPDLADELERLLALAGRAGLVEQVAQLSIVDRCWCGDDNCAHFYTAPKPLGSYGPGHANVMLPAERGLLVVDVVDDAIVAVEVLDRPDVKRLLDLHLPSSTPEKVAT